MCSLCVWESASSAIRGHFAPLWWISLWAISRSGCVCMCVCVTCVKMRTVKRPHSVQPVEVLSWLISSTAVRCTHRPSELWHTKHTQIWVHCVAVSHTSTTVTMTCPSDHSHVLSVPLLWPLFTPWNYSYSHHQLSIVLLTISSSSAIGTLCGFS